jgi:pentatricopeptide repeat protein
MRKLKHQPDTSLLNTLLKSYSITNQHKEIDLILNRFDMPPPPQKSSGGGCSGCSCQSSSSSSSQLSDNSSSKVKKTTKAKKQPKKCTPDLLTFNTLIHYELKNDRINNGLQWYDDMVRADIQPDTVTYGTFIGYYIQKENVEEALRYYDVMERKGIPGNATIYNMLLMGAQQQPTHRNDIMERHRGLLMGLVDQDTVSYNILLSSSIAAGLDKSSDSATVTKASTQFTDIFDQMLSQEVIPNERTYNIALDIYGKLSWHNALDNTISSIMSSMASANLRPDTVTYAINIRNAIYQHNLALGESLLHSMMDAGVKPNTYVFSHLMVGYVQDGDLPRARGLLSKMAQAPYHVKPTAHVFAPLVKGYAQLGNFDQAYSVFKEMLDQGVQPDIVTYTILADMFVEHGSPKEAIRLLSGLQDHATTPAVVDLDHIALGLLMEAHGLAGQSLTSVISPCTTPTTPLAAVSLSPSPSSPHLTAITEIYASIGQSAPIINAIYLTAMARLRQPQHAWDAWAGIAVRHTIHYNALLFGLTQDRAWYPTAKQVFSTMSTRPDGITFDAMVEGALLNNDLAYISTQLWPSPLRPKPTQDDDTDDTLMLVKTYYKVFKAALYCQDYAQAREVYREFLMLPNIPTSATVWKKELHLLALANGLTDKKDTL